MKCKCYIENLDTIIINDPIHNEQDYHIQHLIGHCLGTKETDICNCGGDESKCDFYPEKRNKREDYIMEENTKKVEDFIELIIHGTEVEYAMKRTGVSELDTCTVLHTMSKLLTGFEGLKESVQKVIDMDDVMTDLHKVSCALIK